MKGRLHLSIEDVDTVAPAVLRHRIILNFDAHAEGQTPETILSKIIPSVAAAVHLPCLSRFSTRGFLESLERLTIQWQKSLPGLVGGHNTSRFAGAGQEFLDHRQFHHGDDLRAVNWRAYLRLEKLFLKMFQLEPRIPVRMLIDISKSMETGQIDKFHYARRLAAALCYVGLVRLDSICLQPFSNKLHDAFTASGGRHRFTPAMRFLAGARTGRPDQFPGMLAAVLLEISAARPDHGDLGFPGRPGL